MKRGQFTDFSDLCAHGFKYSSERHEFDSFFVDIFSVDLNKFELTSSAMIISLFLTANSITFFMVSALRIDPVGLPGLITTIAFTFLPCFLD